MRKLSFYSHSSDETIDFAKNISSFLKQGDVVGLFGELGSGKTTFVKGLAKGLGLKAKINSPSFVILKIYTFIKNRSLQKKIIPLFHFDLYRLNSLKELESIGYEDFIYDTGVCVIEWADRANSLLPKDYLKIRIQIKGKDSRSIILAGYGLRYGSLVNRIKRCCKRIK
ncbi:MAG: tRNA (adenosine(37)-N6)-threonylcarbamoyltransferase complex ATPase subunit type 1 TsaE [Candidatus Omnitrophica bacterium]|nr:tRNA (adenosine(37)-N6)-threonylcarbamoyltransferase complex ATPase subunit type 1 TsaE [Candidatus Omnitrophota bacterium]MDD5351946.1 tRNA (adenosine(37)-N6)-threonylcarbamoyltransferase complex ATPase subunit type 1 TsaE [Candidatus Omnitrophota bacterium]MDD5550772.1 tRNA (adenosine(37)-N6)-threonylcarbamoyltransferase complex ATPase subunit type 1 TsaE [Candidatus Omnitrophota bacterium]